MAIGDTSERVGRQGRAVIGYAAKMQAMGVDERSLAGETNPVADHVAAIGREKMRLLSGAPSAPTTAAAASSTRGVTSARHTVAVHKGVRQPRVGTSHNCVFFTVRIPKDVMGRAGMGSWVNAHDSAAPRIHVDAE